MSPRPFSVRLLREASAEASALQLAATLALRLWAALPDAYALAQERHDEDLASHLRWLEGSLTLPEHD